MSTEPRIRHSATTSEHDGAAAPDNAAPGTPDDPRATDEVTHGATDRGDAALAADEHTSTPAAADREAVPLGAEDRNAAAGASSDGADARTSHRAPAHSPASAAATRSADDAATGTDSALVPGDEADQLRTRWREVQAHFVDDPRESVTRADELVGATIERLTTLFAERRRTLAAGWSGSAETEQLRTALRDYRSLFERLVS
ncbi:hypothetical protein [Nocardia higoensis]|uniref:hypothetical protein n=1 Tax=Nocardia higoensis TaxID=228599 RepID=UPI000314848A|nr:hypothetical protein [Nocardia higoensis]